MSNDKMIQFTTTIKPDWKEPLDNLIKLLKRENVLKKPNQENPDFKYALRFEKIIDNWCKRNNEEAMPHRILVQHTGFVNAGKRSEILGMLFNNKKICKYSKYQNGKLVIRYGTEW